MLGEFDDQQVGGDVRGAQHVQHLLGEPGLADLTRRDVHRDAQALRQPGRPPLGEPVDRLLQNPAADLHDHPVVLGQRNERAGGKGGQPGAMPLQQQLEAGHGARVEHDDRLSEQPQLVAFQRAAKRRVQVQSLGDLGFQGRIEDVDVAAVGELGAVHRHVGFAHELSTRHRGLVGEGDTNADVDEGLLAVDRVGRAQRGADAFGQRDGFGPVGQARAQHHELVTAEPGHRVGLADGSGQSPSGLDQQLVSAGVTDRVVDRLEPVEIAEQQRQLRAAAPRREQALGHPRQQQAAVGQAGERVVTGLM